MHCLTYYAQRDENCFPIPGTMEGYRSTPCRDGLVQLLPATPATPAGYMICRHPKGLRFFVQVSPVTKQIIPNSLKSFKRQPGWGCYAEYLKFVPIP
jgi:hypothetical protein